MPQIKVTQTKNPATAILLIILLTLSGFVGLISIPPNANASTSVVTTVDDYPVCGCWYHLNHYIWAEITSDFQKIKNCGYDSIYLCTLSFIDMRDDHIQVRHAMDIAWGLGLKVMLPVFVHETTNPSYFLWDNSNLTNQAGAKTGPGFYNNTWIDGVWKNWLMNMDAYYGDHPAMRGWFLDDTLTGPVNMCSYDDLTKSQWAIWLQDKYHTLAVMKTNWRGLYANGTAAGANWYASWALAGNDPPKTTSTNSYARQDWFDARSGFLDNWAQKTCLYLNTNNTHPVIIEDQLSALYGSDLYYEGFNGSSILNYFSGIAPYIWAGGKVGGQRERSGYGPVATGFALGTAKIGSDKLVIPCLDLNAYEQVVPTLSNLTDQIIAVMREYPATQRFSFSAWVYNWSNTRMPYDYPGIWYNIPILINALRNGSPLGNMDVGIIIPRNCVIQGGGGMLDGSLGAWGESGFKVVQIFQEDLKLSYLNRFKLIILDRAGYYFNETYASILCNATRKFWLMIEYTGDQANQTGATTEASAFRSALGFNWYHDFGGSWTWPFHNCYFKSPSHALLNGISEPFYYWGTSGNLRAVNPTGLGWTKIMNYSVDPTYSCLAVKDSAKLIVSGMDLAGENSSYNTAYGYPEHFKQLYYNIGTYCGANATRYCAFWNLNGSGVGVFNSNMRLGKTITLPSSMRFIVAENMTTITIANSQSWTGTKCQLRNKTTNSLINYTGTFVFNANIGEYQIYVITPTIAPNVIARPTRDVQFIGDTNCLNIIKYEWTFGDGATSTLQNPKHRYSDFGVYTITLKVTDKYYRTNTTTLKFDMAEPAQGISDTLMQSLIVIIPVMIIIGVAVFALTKIRFKPKA